MRLLLAGAVAASVAFVGPVPAVAATAPPGEQVVVDDGHVDIGPLLAGDGWRVLVRDDTGAAPTWREPTDVVLHVPESSTITVPDDPDFAFLGEPGATLWTLPQVQQSGVLWPGWNTEDPSVVGGIAGKVTWSLDEVRGPGEVTVFLTGDFGAPETLFDTRAGLPQQVAIPPGTHTHGNWTFSAPGSYQLDVTMTAAADDGTTLRDAGTLRVFVGDGDPAAAFAEPVGTADVVSADGGVPAMVWVAAAAGLVIVAAALLAIRRRGARR